MKNPIRIRLGLLATAIILVLSYQNCFQMQDPGMRQPASQGDGPPDQPLLNTEKPECQFVSVPTLQSMLRSNLGIPAGDTAILNTNGAPSAQNYIATRGTQLGAVPVNATTGVSNSNCGTLKYKTATELMINACQQASAQSLAALFPNGNDKYETVFRTFLGRNPEPAEIEALNTLVQQTSTTVQRAAVCAAVATSVEALSRNM